MVNVTANWTMTPRNQNGFEIVLSNGGEEIVLDSGILWHIHWAVDEQSVKQDILEFSDWVEDGGEVCNLTPEQIRAHADELAENYIEYRDEREDWIEIARDTINDFVLQEDSGL